MLYLSVGAETRGGEVSSGVERKHRTLERVGQDRTLPPYSRVPRLVPTVRRDASRKARRADLSLASLKGRAARAEESVAGEILEAVDARQNRRFSGHRSAEKIEKGAVQLPQVWRGLLPPKKFV